MRFLVTGEIADRSRPHLRRIMLEIAKRGLVVSR